MKNQLDLFDPPSRPKAILLAFPAERMIGAARDAAAEIVSLPVPKQRAKFNLEVGLLRLRLQRLGFSTLQVAVEVSAFRVAVECEMRRLIIRKALLGNQNGAA